MSNNTLDVHVVRKQIEESIHGQTMLSSLAATAQERADEPAYSDRRTEDGTGWRTLTWGQIREEVLDLAAGLIDQGVQPGDRVCMMATNRLEHVISDAAALHAGAIPVSVYLTLSPEQVLWYARHASPSVVILEGEDQLARWEQALADEQVGENLKTVIVMDAESAQDGQGTWESVKSAGAQLRQTDDSTLQARIAGVGVDDPATILYTSGTTGDPKGVVLTHRNVLYEVEAADMAAEFSGPGVTISYLPLAHIAERVLGLYVPTRKGGHVHLIADPAQLVEALLDVRPTRFFGVPRVWEKIMTGVSVKLAAETDETKKQAVADAMAVGREYVEALQVGETMPPGLAEKFGQYDELVLSPLRSLLGLDRAEWTVSAAAPMPIEVANFFAGLGLSILDVYGMTETTASVTSGTPSAFRLGTVGRALPGIEVKLAEDGEILARGPVVSPGYYNNPEATADLIDEDGWVRTGDLGVMDENHMLKVVDRKKEMIITSSGKNIAPSVVENLLKESPLIGHAMVVGEGRPYLVALLTLDPEIAPLMAAQMGIQETDVAALAGNEQILAMAQQAVEKANARLSRPEQVKKFELLAKEWSAETAELTPTLKLKRRVVNESYADVVEALYAN